MTIVETIQQSVSDAKDDGFARSAEPELTNDTVIVFEGEFTTWGQLMIQDRKTVTWDAERRRYVGGYAF